MNNRYYDNIVIIKSKVFYSYNYNNQLATVTVFYTIAINMQSVAAIVLMIILQLLLEEPWITNNITTDNHTWTTINDNHITVDKI